MRLAETRAALRRNLSGAISAWTDELLDGGIARAIDDLDRVLPLEKLVDFTTTFNITDEVWASATLGTAVTLANKRIRAKSESVKSTGGVTSYSRDTDYTMDYAEGEITTVVGGNIPADTNINISYYVMEVYVDISSLTDLIRVSRMEYPAGNIPSTFQPFYTWGDFLVVTARGHETQQKMAENDHVWVYYHAKHITPDVTIDGSWAPQLDEVVIKGAEGYSLITKSLELRHNAKARLASSLAVLEDELAIIAAEIDTALANTQAQASSASSDLTAIDARLDEMVATLAAAAAFLASAGTSLVSATTQAGQAATDISTAVDTTLVDATSRLATVDGLITRVTDLVDNAKSAVLNADTPINYAKQHLTEVVGLIRESTDGLPQADVARAAARAFLVQGGARLANADDYLRDTVDFVMTALANTSSIPDPITLVGTSVTAAGNELIAAVAATDRVNIGEIVSEMHRRHADSWVAIARLRYEEWLTFLARADRYLAQGNSVLVEAGEWRAGADGYLSEANVVLGEINTLLGQVAGFQDTISRYLDVGQAHISEGQALAGAGSVAVGAAGRGIEQANSYTSIARARLEAASESSGLVNSYVAIAAQYIGMAQAKIAEGNALATPITAILERVSRKIDIARIYQQESDRRLQELTLKQQEADRYLAIAASESALADKFDEVGVRAKTEFMGILLDRAQVRADTALAPTRQEAPS